MFDEDFDKNIPEEQKEILKRFREDLTSQPIRSLNKEESDIYAGAVFRAQQILPSFRDALAVLSPFMDATCSTAYTDQYARVGLSYWFFYLADAETRSMVVLHESMHILNSHFARAETQKVKPRMMNYAGDFEINTNLYTLPTIKNSLENFLIPSKYELPDFKTFEQYVSMIKDKMEEISKDSGNPSDGAEEIDQASQNNDSQSGSDSSSGSESGTDSSSSDASGSDSASSDSQQGNDSESSESGSSSSGEGGSESSDGSGSSQSGDNGDSQGGQGSQPSGYGNSYDDYVRKMNGEDSAGGTGSFEDLLNEEEGKGKCDGNHSKDGKGEPCDGSCDHSSEGDNDGEADGDSQGNNGNGEPEPNSSIDNYKRSMNSGGAKKKVNPPTRHCDDSTVKRSEAADKAGISKVSDIEQNIARNNTSVRIAEELNSGGRGSGASNDFLKLALKRMSPPKVDWRDLFRRAVANAYSASIMGQSYTSYKRVNRRYSQGSVIFPGTIDHSPTVTFAVDTSGSMGQEDFRRLLAEIEDIIKNAARQKNSLKVFSVDTTVKGIEPVSSVDKIKLRGGGGTDMSVAFAYVNLMKKKEMPNIVVLGTDGYTEWSSVEREIRQGSYHAIILVTQANAMNSVPQSLHSVAAVIDISEDN